MYVCVHVCVRVCMRVCVRVCVCVCVCVKSAAGKGSSWYEKVPNSAPVGVQLTALFYLAIKDSLQVLQLSVIIIM